MTIYIYNENCVLSGRQVPQSALYEHGDDCSDWHAEEVSEENAVYWEQQRMGPYGSKVAQAIRAAM